ncbi:MAG TPA: hypothetical protein VJG48_01020, partial [Candidatus Paceibacterota bacterium]
VPAAVERVSNKRDLGPPLVSPVESCFADSVAGCRLFSEVTLAPPRSYYQVVAQCEPMTKDPR